MFFLKIKPTKKGRHNDANNLQRLAAPPYKLPSKSSFRHVDMIVCIGVAGATPLLELRERNQLEVFREGRHAAKCVDTAPRTRWFENAFINPKRTCG